MSVYNARKALRDILERKWLVGEAGDLTDAIEELVTQLICDMRDPSDD